jgi:MtN3 and saliva related transmembrane protein
MDWRTVAGLIAAFCTTISFLPQAVKTIRTKDTSSISKAMYSIFSFGTLMWLIYGLSTGNTPVILANAVTLVFSLIILFYKLREKPTAAGYSVQKEK